MLDNHLYNLMLQLTQENKALWRIKNHYLKDIDACDECRSFWEEMEKDKEKHTNDLMELLKKHM